MKMVQYVITPWRHQSELLAVREALYGEAREAMAEGVERVGVWSKLSLHVSFVSFPGVGLGWDRWGFLGLTARTFGVVIEKEGKQITMSLNLSIKLKRQRLPKTREL